MKKREKTHSKQLKTEDIEIWKEQELHRLGSRYLGGGYLIQPINGVMKLLQIYLSLAGAAIAISTTDDDAVFSKIKHQIHVN